MGVASGSGWNLWVWLAGGGYGWNLWVWLVGVVVRRGKDFLILLIPIYSSCICSLTLHKFKVWMTIVESGWNVWVWLVGVASRRQMWLVGVGEIYGCG